MSATPLCCFYWSHSNAGIPDLQHDKHHNHYNQQALGVPAISVGKAAAAFGIHLILFLSVESSFACWKDAHRFAGLDTVCRSKGLHMPRWRKMAHTQGVSQWKTTMARRQGQDRSKSLLNCWSHSFETWRAFSRFLLMSVSMPWGSGIRPIYRAGQGQFSIISEGWCHSTAGVLAGSVGQSRCHGRPRCDHRILPLSRSWRTCWNAPYNPILQWLDSCQHV